MPEELENVETFEDMFTVEGMTSRDVKVNMPHNFIERNA